MNSLKRAMEKASQIKLLYGFCENPIPLILDSIRFQKKPYEAILKEGNIRFQLNQGCGDWFTIYECCIRKDYISKPVNLKKGDVVLDIGGNFGAFAAISSQVVGEEGHVYCYEPDPISFERIQQHMHINGIDNVTVFNAAVGPSTTQAPLYRTDKSALNTLYFSLNKGVRSKDESVLVDVIGIRSVLDEIGGNVSLAKIDCEGAEYEIFDALENNDITKIAQFAIETHDIKGRSPREIRDRLSRLGYVVDGINPFIAVRKNISSE